MKENPNEWIIQKDPYDTNKKQREERNNRSGATFNVQLCPTCNRVHEDVHFNGEGRKVVYHESFPTYKLKRIDCMRCEK